MAGEKRITVLIDRYLPIIGGAQKNVHQLNQDLVERGYKVQVLTRKVIDGLPDDETIDGIPVRRFGGFPLRVFSKAIAFGQILWYLISHRKDYDIVLCVPCAYYTDVLPAYFAWQFTRRPYLMRTTMTSNFDFMLSLRKIPGAGLLKRLIVPPRLWKSVMEKSAMIVTQSGLQYNRAVAYGITPLALIPNGVDTQRFKPATSAEKKQLREKLGLPLDKVIVLNTGRYIPPKNQSTLLEAAACIEHELRQGQLHLVLLGASEGDTLLAYERKLKNYVQEHNLENVDFINDVDNVEEYLQAADIFVFPTMFDEGMSNATLEAMASGLPIVSSDLSQVKHMFPDEGVLYFSPQDVRMLTSHLTALLDSSDLRLENGAKVAKYANIKYRRTVVADKYSSVFDKILEYRS